MATTNNNNAVARKRKRNLTNWSSVSLDVLGSIATNISSVEDYFTFGAVCKWWRCAAIENKTSIDLNCQKNSPWLMKLYNIGEDDETQSFYSFTRNKLFNIELPELRGRQCFGSPFGWLITFRADHMYPTRVNINLFNPLSKASIRLPYPSKSLKCGGFSRGYKAILTANPDSPDCFVFIRYCYGFVAFTRPGDPVWSPIQTPNIRWKDIIYFKGNVYGCDIHGPIFIFDLSGKELVAFAPSPRELHYTDHYSNFLVELGTELCSVIMFTDPVSDYKRFEIYKIDVETREWARVESLGRWCLVFEDYVTFFAVDPVAAERNKLVPGCIYCGNTRGFVSSIWNVEERTLLRWRWPKDMYSRLYPTTRFTPSLLP